jgi:CubicO group peptidase (beta-lactamase class C family)
MLDATDIAADPAEVGLDPARVEALITRAQREIDSGLLPSCQLAVAREGKVAVFRTFGSASDQTRYVMYSATKPLVASAAWLLIAEGRLDLAAKVAELIPEFATNGKDVVTVEQVMLHTSGFPYAPMHPRLWNDRAARLEQISRWRLNWEPGTAFEYHPSSAHWVLAELIEQASGQDFRDFIREQVCLPLGLPNLRLGVGLDEQEDIARVVGVGEPTTEEEIEAVTGFRITLPREVTEEALMELNEPQHRLAGLPGGGGIATAADLALFYQALLHNPGELWDGALLADVTGHVRCTFADPMTGVPANRTLGLVLAGDDGRANMRHNLGNTVSPGAFGHGGAGGQIGWADPETGLSFAYFTNGLDANVLREARRGVGLSSRAGLLLAD